MKAQDYFQTVKHPVEFFGGHADGVRVLVKKAENGCFRVSEEGFVVMDTLGSRILHTPSGGVYEYLRCEPDPFLPMGFRCRFIHTTSIPALEGDPVKVLYLAGPYRSPRGLLGIKHNIEAASRAAAELWIDGFAVICPHMNTAFMDNSQMDAEDWLRGDIEMLKLCDAVVMLPGWENSEGARGEKAAAEAAGIPVHIWPFRPEK